jgi:hypothetical protein
MNATHSTQRFGSSRYGKAVVIIGFVVGLAIGAAAPAAASNPYQGEGMLAHGQDREQSRTESAASVALVAEATDADCVKGEGLRSNPISGENPCAATATLKAYHICELGEGLLAPDRGPNPCREAID